MTSQPDRNAGDAAWLERVLRHRINAFDAHCRTQPLRPRPQRFVFLRHGETQGNHLRIFQHAQIELNPTGIEQATQAAALLATSGIERVVASDMSRAWQTAEILARSLGTVPIPEARLRERWFGDLVGTSSAELDWSFDPPNGERLADFVARTREGIEAALDTEVPTLLIAHGGTLYVLAYCLGVRLREEMANNATPLLFGLQDGAWTVTLAGDTPLARGGNIGW